MCFDDLHGAFMENIKLAWGIEKIVSVRAATAQLSYKGQNMMLDLSALVYGLLYCGIHTEEVHDLFLEVVQ